MDGRLCCIGRKINHKKKICRQEIFFTSILSFIDERLGTRHASAPKQPKVCVCIINKNSDGIVGEKNEETHQNSRHEGNS